MIRCEVQLRWADVDELGHVNNVAYAAYFEDAHHRLLNARADAVGEHPWAVRRQEISYLSPLMFGTGSTVATRAWLDATQGEPVVLAELFEDAPGEQRVLARSRVVLGPSPGQGRGRAPALDPNLVERAHHSAAAVRFADLSPQGVVADTAVFEYLQEARIALMAQMDLEPTSTVVAHKDVDFHRPDLAQSVALDVWSWVSRIGNRSMTIDSVVAHGDTAFARGSSTLVFFDARTQRSVTPSPTVTQALRSRQL
ncbi:thioesterase family protein [Nocardioides albidus]|uniref:acyl-CoA thioesterase n=1 Tax=Nocardioides albidus TaxID=1517589 RepID=UPI00130547D5|nr:thioesterase family protein [Nocardioides albidus]